MFNRPIIAKQGKSKRGVWTKEQKEYTDRCVSAGCIACIVGRQIHESPSQWHHSKDGWHGAAMRSPHEYGLALCPTDHWLVHHRPRDFEVLVGMSEAELVKVSQKLFHWSEQQDFERKGAGIESYSPHASVFSSDSE